MTRDTARHRRWFSDVPPDRWAGLGDDRRYILHGDGMGITWAWFQTAEGGWAHTLDPVGGLWTMHGPVDSDALDNLRKHIEGIPHGRGCGVRGLCQHHERVPASESNDG